MPEAVVVAAVRTPIGKRDGALSSIHATDLSARVLNELVARTGIDPGDVDDVMWGCVTQLGDQSSNVGRFATLAAGWPEHVPAVTINRACGSSQQAIDSAAHAVMAGQQQMVVAGGVEMMSRVPLGAARATGEPYGPTVLARYGVEDFSQLHGAELMAERRGLSRRDLDEYSATSHERAGTATDSGEFAEQVVPVCAGQTALAHDEGIRRGSTVETLGQLKPILGDDGRVHAGNASQISDGAAALLVTTPERAAALGLKPIVRYHTGAVRAADPVTVLEGPMPATELVLKRSGLSLADIGVYEINEAFATVPLAWQRHFDADAARLNPLGGAIAVGHPLGASGAILMTRMVHHMRDRGIRYGLQAMCETGGTANATIVELVD